MPSRFHKWFFLKTPCPPSMTKSQYPANTGIYSSSIHLMFTHTSKLIWIHMVKRGYVLKSLCNIYDSYFAMNVVPSYEGVVQSMINFWVKCIILVLLHLWAQTRFLPCALTSSLDSTTICHGKNAFNVFLKVFGFTQFLLMFFFPGMFDISCVCVYNVIYTTSCLSPIWQRLILNLFWVDKISPKYEGRFGTVTLTKAFLNFWGKTPQPRSQGFELGSIDL